MAAVTAGLGFLLAVLWFDLMHDTVVLSHRDTDVLPEAALATIAGYYRRVTTDASPMNVLVALVMVATTGGVVAELVRDTVPTWVAWTTIGLGVPPMALAAARTVPAAVRLGQRTDTVAVQSRAARSILRHHLVCFVFIASAIGVQLLGGR